MRAAPLYAELPPCAALAPWVACFWTLRATGAAGSANRVLPDGCSDVIVDLSAQPESFVVGTMRRAIVVPVPDHLDLFGIRFRPGAALPFLDVPLAELTDRRVALAALWGREATAVPGTFADAACDARTRAAHAESILLRRLRAASTHAARLDRDADLVERAVALLRHARGSVGIREAARALGVGERRLERAFDRRVGVSPKFLARVVRFRAALRALERRAATGGPGGGASVAFAAGYADQPHLVREFRALAGVAPTEYLAERWRVGFVQAGEAERA